MSEMTTLAEKKTEMLDLRLIQYLFESSFFRELTSFESINLILNDLKECGKTEPIIFLINHMETASKQALESKQCDEFFLKMLYDDRQKYQSNLEKLYDVVQEGRIGAMLEYKRKVTICEYEIKKIRITMRQDEMRSLKLSKALKHLYDCLDDEIRHQTLNLFSPEHIKNVFSEKSVVEKQGDTCQTSVGAMTDGWLGNPVLS